MSTENFDIDSLKNRIAELKKETEESTQFTHDYIECLIKRHDLVEIIHPDHEFEDIPKELIEKIKGGVVPTKEEISELDIDTQDFFIKDLVWICGMGAIAWYSENDDNHKKSDPKPFDEIIEMPNISPGHHSASYIIAALTLLMSGIPSQDMVAAMTDNFSDSEEQMEKNSFYYSDLCFSILRRYKEDVDYLLGETNE